MGAPSNPNDFQIDQSAQYIALAAAGVDDAIPASQTDLEVGATELRHDGAVLGVVLSCTTSSGGASRATVQVTDGTNDLISSDTLLVSAGSVEILADDLVTAQQGRAAGDRIQVDITTVASETVTGFNAQLIYRPTPRDS